MKAAEEFQLKVPFLYQSKRMDLYVTGALEGRFSRQEIKAALKGGNIRLNGKPARPSLQVKEGDLIEGSVATSRTSTLDPEEIELNVVHEDDDLIVIDKPAGLVVHPGAGHKSGTLVHALLGKGRALSSLGGTERPGIVHRLDKMTSGLLVVAKNNRSHRLLQAQFAEHTLSRTYVALVKGRVEYEQGRVCEPIGRHPKQRLKMAIVRSETARDAETHYRVLERFAYASLLELKLLTGRTHQIRVHMAHLGHPVVGDDLYGTLESGPHHAVSTSRQALHAAKLEFIHPRTGDIVKFESPWPSDFKEMVDKAKSAKLIEGTSKNG